MLSWCDSSSYVWDCSVSAGLMILVGHVAAGTGSHPKLIGETRARSRLKPGSWKAGDSS
jgi:hypothetical protein